ncbi:alcohol dehydrogenase [Xylariaceae sp. FL1019]|nr:alcohol dehydrogenase [Xylariaceae sp. FL1019]
MADALPTTMRALVQTGPNTATVETVPVPKVTYGSALVKVSAALVHSNVANIFKAEHSMFQLPYPVTPGAGGIGRIAALGPDAVRLQNGQLVMIASHIRARDDPSTHVILGVSAGLSESSRNLYKASASSGLYAEYAFAPLENVYPLDEARLLGPVSSGGLGYHIAELQVLSANAIAYSGLRGIGVKPGERVIITPATGHYSLAAVDVAVAIGARVIAASRSAAGLAKIKSTYPSSVETVQLSGDLETDGKALGAFGLVDAVIDVSPPAATGATNLEAGVSVLRERGRVLLLGGRADETLPIPYWKAMLNSWTIKGVCMYEREDIEGTIRLAEAGLLKLGKAAGHEIHGEFSLDEFQKAVDKSVETAAAGPGSIISIRP